MEKDKRLQTLCLLLMAAAMYSKDKKQDLPARLPSAPMAEEGAPLKGSVASHRP